ncbi:MAG: hypothetical protein Q8K60_07315 [Parachlamydiaceae bacterium]|nr:hypothetical protein [Parachlamydiaceae bacterium]
MFPITPNTIPITIVSHESQEEVNENEVASFLKLSHVIAKKFADVESNPAAFFDLSQIDIPQFIKIPCAIFSDQAEENVETTLNLIYTSNTKVFHHDKTVLFHLNPQPFGFRECRLELKNRDVVILSFPNNKLFNALLNRLPSLFSFAVQSTYLVVGEAPRATHVAKWIESNSWPYDGEANNLERLTETFHDAHHIIKSLLSSHLRANVLLMLKSRLKEKNLDQIIENAASELSSDLEALHNEGSDLRTKFFQITSSGINLTGDSRSIANLFSGIMDHSDFPMKLKETQEDFQKRCQIERKIFYYTLRDSILAMSKRQKIIL